MLEWQVGCANDREYQLSVVVPAWNYASRLPVCLQSVIDQLNERCELIVVDDGSTDDTLEVLKAFRIPVGKRVGYLSQRNAGPAAARNRAVAASGGRWILPLDADDELCPGTIEAVLAKLDSKPDTELLLGASYVRDQHGIIQLRAPAALAQVAWQRLEDYLLRGRLSMLHGACVFARSILLECPYAEHMRQGEDIAVFARALVSQRIVSLTKPLVIINKHADSLRHDVDLALIHGRDVAGAVFAHLPAEFAGLRPLFESQRALSTFRCCYRARRFDLADKLYRQAWRLSWRQAMRWSYLSKWLRMRLSVKSGNSAERG
jgi:glycosyltransferase involved in cell wall biosynthesis